MTLTESRLYVGTYAKYNNGDLTGEWLDLADYDDKDEFLEACAELHADESDPEFMFQDCEGIPDAMYSECSIDERLFEWAALHDDERDIVQAYWDGIDSDASTTQALDAFTGKFDSLED